MGIDPLKLFKVHPTLRPFFVPWSTTETAHIAEVPASRLETLDSNPNRRHLRPTQKRV